MWRFVRVQRCRGASAVVGQRTMMAGNTTTTNKRTLREQQLKGPSSSSAKRTPGTSGLGKTSPSASTTRPATPPPSGGAGGKGGTNLMPIMLLGGAALAGFAAYQYSNDENLMNRLPWKQQDPMPTASTSTHVDSTPAVAPTTEVPSSASTPAVSAEVASMPSTEEEQSPAVSKKEEEEGLLIMKEAEVSSEKSSGEQGTEISTTTMIKEPSDVADPVPEESTSADHFPEQSQIIQQQQKDLVKEKKENVMDTSSTIKAIEHLQSASTLEAAKSLIQSHQALWSSLDSTFFADLDSLSPAQLKARVVQLATEMKDRTQWEAVRLKEFLALKEKETAQQYQEILLKQRLEFEELLANRLREQDGVFHKQLKEALDQKDASIETVVNAALEALQEEHNQDKEAFATKFQNETQLSLNKQYGEQMEVYKKAMEKDLQEKVTTLSTLSEKLRKLEAALEASQKTQKGSSQAHKLSAAALALSEVLETHAPAAKHIKALKSSAGQDGVIATAVGTLPQSVATEGVPTLSELQTRFEETYSTCRQAALVPPGRPGLDGQLAGMLFANLKYPPQPDDPPPTDSPNNAEYVLARARKHVQLGELGMAIDELEKLHGQVAFVVQDWKQAAMDRVAVEKAVKVIKLECALLHESVLN